MFELNGVTMNQILHMIRAMFRDSGHAKTVILYCSEWLTDPDHFDEIVEALKTAYEALPKPNDKSVAETVETPVESSVANSEASTDAPAAGESETTAATTEDTGEASGTQEEVETGQAPSEPVPVATETPVETSVEAVVETPAETVVETPAETPAPKPVKKWTPKKAV